MAQPTYQELLDENRQLRQENQRLREENRQLHLRVDALEAQVLKLTQLVEQAQRAGKRQAAPFSKGPPKDNPKTPGRKAGESYGPKAHRPLPEQKPDEIIDVPLPQQCPDCGGEAQEDHVDHQFQVEIPRKPIIRRFDIHVGRCPRCGRRIQPRHSLQTSNALGAASSQLGPDLQALIALMKDKYGLSYGDIQGLLDEAFGISLTRGGAAQVVLRVADCVKPAYQRIGQIVRASDTVYPDRVPA
jgi:transposase